MALTYKPINGFAGTVKFELIDRASNVVQNTVSLDIVNFDEEDEESEFTDVFENINNETIKDYHGFKKRISLGVVNGISGSGGVLGENNLSNILSLASMINLLNNSPQTYRLSITYRTGSGAVINDAIQLGSIKLNELSANSNSGQVIDLVFASRQSSDLSYQVDTYNLGLALEDDSGYILLENGNLILLETYLISES